MKQTFQTTKNPPRTKLLKRLVNLLSTGSISSDIENRSQTDVRDTKSLQDGFDAMKITRFSEIIGSDIVDMIKLREIVWSGCPCGNPAIRAVSWKILLGVIPPRVHRHEETRLKRSKEYQNLLHEHKCNIDASSSRESGINDVVHQIEIDIPRTVTLGQEFVKSDPFLSVVRRVLIIWSLRNPACGYVQGMNDIAVSLLLVLLEGAAGHPLSGSQESEIWRLDLFPIESDLYWTFSRVIQGVQDHYTSSQPGIQKMMKHFRDVILRIDRDLFNHLENAQIDIQQISFRWFNCLFTRELSYQCLVRLWDTCIAEDDGFSVFLVYFCTVLVTRRSQQIKKMDFQEIMALFGNSLDSFGVTNVRDVEAIISEAFVLKTLFHSSPNHLNSS